MNTTQRQLTIFSSIAISVFILSGFAFQNYAFAATQGMEFSLSASEGSTTISASGITSITNEPVTIKVVEPKFGNLIHIDQVVPSVDGSFSTNIKTGALWDGTFTVTAGQGERVLYSISLPVEVSNGKTLATSVSDSSLVQIFTGGITFDKDRGLRLEVDAPLGSTTIGISGHTGRTNMDVTIVVTEPVFGNIIHTDQVSPDINGNFMTKINVGGSQWKQNGFYTISASQGGGSIFTDSAEVEIVDGAVIPEFGAIAALILAVAIISIIVVSAKTKLNLIPRY